MSRLSREARTNIGMISLFWPRKRWWQTFIFLLTLVQRHQRATLNQGLNGPWQHIFCQTTIFKQVHDSNAAWVFLLYWEEGGLDCETGQIFLAALWLQNNTHLYLLVVDLRPVNTIGLCQLPHTSRKNSAAASNLFNNCCSVSSFQAPSLSVCRSCVICPDMIEMRVQLHFCLLLG